VQIRELLATMWWITSPYKLVGAKEACILTNVYEPILLGQKHGFLKSLDFIENFISLEYWILGGDFNIIKSLREKKGGIRHLEEASGWFVDFLEQHTLVDMESKNDIFT
jgi:hypothetical protein